MGRRNAVSSLQPLSGLPAPASELDSFLCLPASGGILGRGLAGVLPGRGQGQGTSGSDVPAWLVPSCQLLQSHGCLSLPACVLYSSARGDWICACWLHPGFSLLLVSASCKPSTLRLAFWEGGQLCLWPLRRPLSPPSHPQRFQRTGAQECHTK